MCPCKAHHKFVECTCDCDHTEDRLSQLMKVVAQLETKVEQLERYCGFYQPTPEEVRQEARDRQRAANTIVFENNVSGNIGTHVSGETINITSL